MALAQFDGIENINSVCWRGHKIIGGVLTEIKIPDYLNDLNAIHEIEIKLDKNKMTEYSTNLFYICKEDNIWLATASQRAKAILKTFGF